MFKFNELVFDEIIQTGGTGTYYTKQQMNDLLGECDQLAFHILADDVVASSGTPTIQVSIETSCDGSNWVTKLGPVPITVSTTGLNQNVGQDDGSKPSYALVRFCFVFTCTSPATAHLAVWVTGRDTGTRRTRNAHMPKMSQYFAYYKNKHVSHKLTEEEKAAMFKLCMEKRLGYKACMQHFGPNYDWKQQ